MRQPETRAFSSEVESGSREENAIKQEIGAFSVKLNSPISALVGPAMRKAIFGAALAAWVSVLNPPAGAAELVMVERDDCSWCKRWHAEVGESYMKAEEGRQAPLRRWRLEQGQPKLAMKEPVRFTPTFILVEDGREIGRITGYLENGMFWGLLGDLLKKAQSQQAR